MSNGRSGRQLMQEIQDQFLVCKICFEPYRRPKTLTCLHTFCTQCLEQHLEAEMERSYRYMLYSRALTCPICRKKTEVPTGGIKKLPDNFVVENLTDIVSRRKPSDKGPLCEICQANSHSYAKRAISKCLDCVKLLCEDCVELHKRTKVTQSHSLFDVETERDIACKTHADECVRFYCEPCEMCICVVCTFQEHKGHEVFSFNEGLAKYRHCLDELTESCKERINRLRGHLELIGKCENELKFTEEQIRDTAIASISAIRKREKQMVDDLYIAYGDNTLNFLKGKQGFQDDLDNLVSTCNLTEIIMKDNSIELLLLKKEIQAKLSDIVQKHLDEPPERVRKELKFIPGTMILGHLNMGGEDLGIVKSSESVPVPIPSKNARIQTDSTYVENKGTTMGQLLCDYNLEQCTQTVKQSVTEMGINTSPTANQSKMTMTTPDTKQNAVQTATTPPSMIQRKIQTDPFKGVDKGSATNQVNTADLGINTNSVSLCERSTLTMQKEYSDSASETIGLVSQSHQSTETPTVQVTHSSSITDKTQCENKGTSIDEPTVADKMTGTPKISMVTKECGTPRVLTLDMGINTRIVGENKATSTKVIVTTDSFTGLGDVRTKSQGVETTWKMPSTRSCGTMHEVNLRDKMVSAVTEVRDQCLDAWRGLSKDASTQDVKSTCDKGVSVALQADASKQVPISKSVSSQNTQTLTEVIAKCEQGINTDLLPFLRPKSNAETTMKSFVFSCNQSTGTERVIIRPWVEFKSVGTSTEPLKPSAEVHVPAKFQPSKPQTKPSSGPVSAAKSKLLKSKSSENGSKMSIHEKVDTSSGTDSPGLATAVAALINSVTITGSAPVSRPPGQVKNKSLTSSSVSKKGTEKPQPKPIMVDACTGYDKPFTSDVASGSSHGVTSTEDIGIGVNLPNTDVKSIGTGTTLIKRQDSTTETDKVSLADSGTDAHKQPMADKEVHVGTSASEKGTSTAAMETRTMGTTACIKEPTMDQHTNTKAQHLITMGTNTSLETKHMKVGTAVSTSNASVATTKVSMGHKMVATEKPRGHSRQTNTAVIETADKRIMAQNIAVGDSATMTSIETNSQATSPHQPYTKTLSTSTTAIDTSEIGVTAQPTGVDVGVHQRPNMVSIGVGTKPHVMTYQDQATNTPLPTNIDRDSLGQLYDDVDKVLDSVKIRSIDSDTFSERLKIFGKDSPTGSRTKLNQLAPPGSLSRGVNAVTEMTNSSMGTENAILTDNGTSMPQINTVNRALSPICGLGLQSKTTSMQSIALVDSETSMAQQCFADMASNTITKTMIDREATPIRFPTKDSEVMAVVTMENKEATTPVITMQDMSTSTKMGRMLNSSTSMPQIVQVEKETTTPHVHVLHKNMSTENTSTSDKHTEMSPDITTAYCNHIGRIRPLSFTRGTSMSIEGQDKSTSPPPGKQYTEKGSSPIRFPCVDKAVSVKKGEILEPVDKFQAPGKVMQEKLSGGDSSEDLSFRPNLSSIREDSLEWDDEGEEGDDDAFSTPDKEAPLRHKETFVPMRNGKTTENGSTFAVKGQQVASNILWKVEAGTNTRIDMQNKETSTPPLDTEDKCTTTESVVVGDKMAECINKLKAVRQRLEQPSSCTPPSTPTTLSPKREPQPAPSGCISSSEESEAGAHFIPMNRKKSKSFGDRLHEAKEFFPHSTVLHRQMSTESVASSNAASDSGMELNPSRPKLARKQRLDITQLLRSSSAPEKDNPPYALAKPKLQVTAVQRQVIPKLNFEEIENKSNKQQQQKLKKKVKTRSRSTEDAKGLSSPENTPKTRRRIAGLVTPQNVRVRDVVSTQYLSEKPSMRSKLWERRITNQAITPPGNKNEFGVRYGPPRVNTDAPKPAGGAVKVEKTPVEASSAKMSDATLSKGTKNA